MKTKFVPRTDAELAAARVANPPIDRNRERKGMRVTERGELTRLQVGMIVLLNGAEHRVEMVNECRARCVPLAKHKKIVVIKDKLNDSKSKEFEAEVTGASVSISPNSDIPILKAA